MNNSVHTQGSYIELSEHRNYLELSNLVCYYDAPSLNGLQLDYGNNDDEQAETLQKAKTLCLMPVYAKVTVNAKAEPTFAGHEAVRKANGEVIYKTIPIGVHESVVVEDHEVEIPSTGETKTLPCLVAKQRIWSRNKNAVAAIKRLFAEGHLHNSFEMEVSQYVYDNGVRHAKEYEFVGNAFLASDSITRGASVKPAYGNSARVMEVAEEMPNCVVELANALAMDMAENKDEVNDKMLENEEAQVVEETNQVTETQPEQVEVQETMETPVEETVEQPVQEESAEQIEETQPVQEQSALTDYDIRRMVGKAYREAHKGCYAYVSFMFPEEHIAWMKVDEQLEAEFTQVSYSVENDTVTLTDEQVVKIALPVRELSAAYEKQATEIEGLKAEISELAPYKEKIVAQEKAEAEAKHQKEVSDLRTLAEQAQCFTEDELSAMSDLFEQVKVMEVKAAIFDKKSAMMDKVETSAAEETPKDEPKANLEHEQTDSIASVRRFLNV